jgi:hypothetical protein
MRELLKERSNVRKRFSERELMKERFSESGRFNGREI